MADSYTDAETERLRRLAKELCEELGPAKLAVQLGMVRPALEDFLTGTAPAKAHIARGLARIKRTTVEELFALPTVAVEAAPLTHAAVTEVSAPPSIASVHAIAEPPRMDAIAPPAVPSVAVAPVPASAGEPTRRAETETRQPTLTMLEYASVTMGLETVPHLRDDVFNKFGLASETAREAELAAWEAYFEENPHERREWKARHERMRTDWLEFDQKREGPAPKARSLPHTPIAPMAFAAPPLAPAPRPPSIRSTLSTGGSLPEQAHIAPHPPIAPTLGIPAWTPPENGTAAYLGPIVFSPEAAIAAVAVAAEPIRQTPQPRLPLEVYARLGIEVQLAPAQAESTFRQHGLMTAHDREAEDAAWRRRLAANPAEQADWVRLCDDWGARLRRSLAPAPTASSPPAVDPANLPPRPTKLGKYAMLHLTLEKKPLQKEETYALYGLVDPKRRREFEEAWRIRFEALPAERAEWQAIVDRLRADWVDL